MAGSFLNDDLDVFLNSNEFSETATLNFSVGGSSTVGCILDEELIYGDQYNNSVGDESVNITIKTSDVGLLTVNDTVIITNADFGAITYRVNSVPDISGNGLTILVCERLTDRKI